MTTLTAIILAGGRSQRMGCDKATIPWGAEAAIHRVARLAREAGATDVVVSGGDYGLPFVPDPIAHGGPVGGLLSAAAARPAADRFLMLAVDAPTLRVADLGLLLAASPPGAAYDGFPLPMCVARAAMPWALPIDASLRRFVEAAGLRILPPVISTTPHLRGANTPQDLDGLRLAPRSTEDVT